MSRQNDKLLKVENVSHAFINEAGEKNTVIRNISFSLKPGGFTCILGPSGCGKTTLLRAIAGLIRPAAGRVYFNGRIVKGLGRDAGFVFQEGPLFPWRNVLDNAAFGLEVRGMKRSERISRAREVLKLVGISLEDEKKHTYELSGGMQQRVAIAQALCPDPKILILDEPFVSLDEITSQRLQNELVRIWQASRKTIIFVTHQIEDAVFMGERVLIMGAEPARIIENIEINLPYPRNRAGDVFAERFLAIRKKYHAIFQEKI